MIKDSARVIVDVDQAVEDMLGVARSQGYQATDQRLHADADRRLALDGDAAVAFGAVTEGTTVEDVVRSTGLSASRAAAVLTELELDGLVEPEGGGRWRRR